MRDIATATLSGNLTRDVELRQLPSGADAARLRVATTTRRRAGEEWVDKTNYFTVEVYGAQARACAQYLRKGSRVFVDAELDWREWTDQQDNKREAVTFKARQVLFEGTRPNAEAAADSPGGGAEAPASPAASDTAAVSATAAGGDGAGAPDDDLPFGGGRRDDRARSDEHGPDLRQVQRTERMGQRDHPRPATWWSARSRG